MESLIADLLAYSRLTRAQIALQPVDLDAAVQDALQQISVQIQETAVAISIASPLGCVLAHRPTLVQILVNLLSNAVKFMPSEVRPQIEIHSQEDEQTERDWICLEIVDNGIGIALEHQSR
ncbi:MAG: multi-sensor signal transduction histidine kinase, partial [Microcoleus sp. SIO2G3]|nr:multi-sensor signal transduction histidine kinase [Microcoleus sp. SIO2G3]